jgi:hypothetical protein
VLVGVAGALADLSWSVPAFAVWGAPALPSLTAWPCALALAELLLVAALGWAKAGVARQNPIKTPQNRNRMLFSAKDVMCEHSTKENPGGFPPGCFWLTKQRQILTLPVLAALTR